MFKQIDVFEVYCSVMYMSKNKCKARFISLAISLHPIQTGPRFLAISKKYTELRNEPCKARCYYPCGTIVVTGPTK